MSIKQLVENPHEVYKTYVNYWNFLLDSYEGGVDYTSADIQKGSKTDDNGIQIYTNGKEWNPQNQSNLFKHKKELDSDYKSRLSMSFYYNYCAPVIDIYTNHLYKQPIKQDLLEGSIAKEFEIRKDNMDRMGSSLDEIRHNYAELSQIYGVSYALVDSPMAKGEVNFEQQIMNDSFPYITMYHPQRLLNWALDCFGKPHWVLLCDSEDANDDPFNMDFNKMSKKSYRLWTRKEWVVYNADYEEISRGYHKLGEVPLVPIFDKKSKKRTNFYGISTISDIAFINRDIYNLLSELTQIIRDQSFSFLALQGKKDDYNSVEVGTNKGLLYPLDTNVPQYISPPPANAEIIKDQIDREIEKIYEIAKLEGSSGSQTKQVTNQSGISKAFDFHQTNSALSNKASNLEDAEGKIFTLFARWLGKEYDGSVEYPRNFSVSDVNEDIDEAINSSKLNLGNIARIEMNKAIVKKKFPSMDDETMGKMILEIEASTEVKPNENKLFNRLQFNQPTNTQLGTQN